MTMQPPVLTAGGPEVGSNFGEPSIAELGSQIITLKSAIDLGNPDPTILREYVDLQGQLGLAQLRQETVTSTPRPDFVTAYAGQYSRATRAADAMSQETLDLSGASRLQEFWHHQAGMRFGELERDSMPADARQKIHSTWIGIADEYRSQQIALTGPTQYKHGQRIGTNS